MTHTPGPWTAAKNVPASGRGYSVWTIYPPLEAGERIGSSLGEVYTGEVDARLVAAAPRLLATLRTIVTAIEARTATTHSVRGLARHAIAEATGEQP